MEDRRGATRRALLVVDVQNDFCEGGSLAVEGGHRVAADIAAHLVAHRGRYAAVVASADWHDPGGGNGGHFAAPDQDPDYQVTWPVHCVAGTVGAEHAPGLAPALDGGLVDHRVRKGQGRPAYSAFEGVDEDGRSLQDLVEEAGVTDVDVCGIATDYCVRATSLDAVAAGLRVRVLSDLVAGVAPDSTRAALDELAAAGVEVTSF